MDEIAGLSSAISVGRIVEYNSRARKRVSGEDVDEQVAWA